MLQSKQGSGSIGISQNNHSLVVTKTSFPSTYSKGSSSTSEFNPKLYASLQRKPSKIANTPEKRIVRVSEMQQRMGNLQQELSQMQDKLSAVEEQRDRAFDELKEMKNVAEVANMKLSEAMSTQKVADIYTEYNVVKESLKNAKQELSTKEKHIDFLKIQLGKRKELERKLEEKDTLLDKLKEELSNVKASEACMSDLLSDSMKRIELLEAELEKERQSGEKLFDTLAVQTKVLELTKISLEEAMLEIGSLRKQVGKLEGSSDKGLRESKTLPKDYHLTKESSETLEGKHESAQENIKSILEEKEFIKNELKMATEAEENSKKAMDDLALALKEVATEAKEVKVKLNLTEEELKRVKAEAENLKLELKNAEANFKVQLHEARKEADTYKNKADRLRLEAEETLLTWTGKETGFVNCIKRVEEEKAALLEENRKLHESLIAAENMTKTAKEETNKVRDILKQAVNEANIAKEAAGIAQIENSQLKDALVEKDNALNFISQENESLKINEAAANENIKELKRLLNETSEKDPKWEEKEQGKKPKPQNSADKEPKDGKKLGKSVSLNLKELKIPHKHKDADEDAKNSNKHNEANKQNDPNKHNDSNTASEEDDESPEEESDPLKGSIFDVVESPMEAATHHRKKSSSAFTEEAESINLEDFDHIDGAHFDELDIDKNSRKKKALLRRFGDLIKRKSFHKKEASME